MNASTLKIPLVTTLTLLVALALAVSTAWAGGAEEEQPTPTPEAMTDAAGYKESPVLAAKVAAGELPPIEQRLPNEPLVLSAEWNDVPAPDLDFQVGKHGGTLRAVRTGANWDADVWAMQTEPLISAPGWMDANPKDLRGNVLRDFESSDDLRSFTFSMREGLKWSDGMPVTTEDILFTWEDFLLNDELTPVDASGTRALPQWMRSLNRPDGEPMTLEVIDEFNFRISFPDPYPGFISNFAVYWANYRDLLKPKHHLQQFHADYASAEDLQARLEEEAMEADQWPQLFMHKDHNHWEQCARTAVGFPVLSPWVMTTVTPTATVYERNPYYFKVDSAGQQLPYFDAVHSEHITDRETINLKIIAGELDLVEREAGGPNLPLYKENEERGGYTVTMLQQHFAPVNVFVNMNHEDPEWRKLAQDIRFRRALNMAIDREDIIDKVFFGFAEMPYLVPSDYDPDLANQLLDEMGLERGADGIRVGPDGNKLEFDIEYPPWSTDFAPVLELVSRDWAELGLRASPKEIESSLYTVRRTSYQVKAGTGWDDVENWWLFSRIWSSPYFSAWAWKEWIISNGARGEEPPPWVKEFFRLSDEIKEVSYAEAQEKVKEAQQVMYDNVYYFVTVNRNRKPLVASNKLGNIPTSGLVLVGVNAGEQIFFK